MYLKIFAALYEGRPSTTADTLRTWARAFPDDAPDLDRVVRAALLGQPLPDAPEIWLANDALLTGTSLFDQYRGLPRVHTFDINAATEFDWLTVPGVTPEVAADLVAGAPYPSLEALLASRAIPPPLRARVSEMSAAMARLLERAAAEEESLSLWTIIRPYLWRLGVLILVAACAGAWLARRAGVRRVWTAALLALSATLCVIFFAWIASSPAWYPFAAPVAIGGLPWALWRLARRRGARSAAQALVTWAVAALPALALMF